MGFRFRKSKNFGPFRVNVSKSGIGWSVGGKGFRHTKRADGKTQNTYSIPGTGVSYVDVKDNNSNFSDLSSTSTNTQKPNMRNNKRPPKWLLIILAVLIYILLLVSFPKVFGALTLLGGLGLFYYLFAKSSTFKGKHILIKIFTSVLLFGFMFFFGLGGLLSTTSDNISNENISQNSSMTNDDKEDDQIFVEETNNKSDEEDKLKEQQEAQQKAEEEAKLKAEQEAQQKAKDDQAAKEKAQAEQKAKSEQATQSTSQPQSQQGSSSSSSSSSGQGLIKGNINSKGEKIYHVPGSTYYDRTDPERWFNTVEEAQAAGFRAPKK
ncbi:DUF4236 domain-containing protein [Clostridium intestinale]|uniref:DUF4236 domain-containing protein n=1 Tax=Clostridium intestinale TaxID=36845 RepID=UPI002DD68F9A|nr:DUF4236 domain-containing protein [Clostridium intestinale]WRY52588.1 DUF4236 domain-containing protein [Clostridium intestinale]